MSKIFNLDRKINRYKNDSKLVKCLDFICQILVGLMAICLLGISTYLVRSDINQIGIILIYVCAAVMILLTAISYIDYLYVWICNITFYLEYRDTTVTSKIFNTVIFILNMICSIALLTGTIITLSIFLR